MDNTLSIKQFTATSELSLDYNKLFCISSRRKSNIKHCQVRVEFADGLAIHQITEEINQLFAPQIIVWYIGCYGLRKAGVEFYRDFLISPVLKSHSDAVFWLIDLTGWSAFKGPQGSIHKASSCCDKIESFSDPRISCLRSSKIFKKIQNLDIELIDYFQKALQREFISRSSKHFPDANIRVQEVFSGHCPVMSYWFESDASKSYSICQYLEGCLLVDEIFSHLVTEEASDEIEIVFAIPNDEIKYYKDDLGSFEKDIEFLLSQRCRSLNINNVRVLIKFRAFTYGTQLHHRPYNAPGDILGENKLSYEILVGQKQHNQLNLRQ